MTLFEIFWPSNAVTVVKKCCNPLWGKTYTGRVDIVWKCTYFLSLADLMQSKLLQSFNSKGKIASNWYISSYILHINRCYKSYTFIIISKLHFYKCEWWKNLHYTCYNGIVKIVKKNSFGKIIINPSWIPLWILWAVGVKV